MTLVDRVTLMDWATSGLARLKSPAYFDGFRPVGKSDELSDVRSLGDVGSVGDVSGLGDVG